MWREFFQRAKQVRTGSKATVQAVAGSARVGQAGSAGPLSRMRQRIAETMGGAQVFLGRSSTVLTIMAFFLGRAMILGELSPFAIAFYAVILRLKRSAARWVLGALILGSFTTNGLFSIWPVLVAALLLYRFVYGMLSKKKALTLGSVPFVVFLVDSGVRLAGNAATGDMSSYSLLMGLVNGFLSMVLTLIFIQSLPIFTFQRGVKELRNEEIICLVILLASMLTGLHGLHYGAVSFENVFSRYLIMLFAMIGGAGVAASVGVVTGIILTMASVMSASQIGLLAFSGLLAGLLRDVKKIGVGIGFGLGAAILTVYVQDTSSVLVALEESAVAFGMLILTPKSFIDQVSRYVPGTHQHSLTQQDYARRIRELMAMRIREVSSVFQELSHTFTQISSASQKVHAQDEVMNKTFESAAGQVCKGCFKQEQCWEKNFYQTYRALFDTVTLIDIEGSITKAQVPQELNKFCVKTEAMIPALTGAVEMSKRDMQWQNQLAESRNMVAEQLVGISSIMADLAQEIRKENHVSADHEEHIVAALEHLGLSIRSVDIVSLEEGKVEIEVTSTGATSADEGEKLIAPLLSEVLGENIVVTNSRYWADENGVTMTLSSAKLYHIETGVASAAKDGRLHCGDSFTALDVGNGKYAVAVSDGMGNGERAMQESSAAIRLLQQLLKAGFDEQLAIKTVNSVLLLRSQDEIFTTMDLALIDMFTAKTEFLKIGSAPSFIKRHGKVNAISGQNVPIGILKEIDIQTVEEELQEGDLLILMSDGIFDAPKHTDDKEGWLKKKLEDFDSSDPQEIADMLVELAVRINHGKIIDDMTVLVAKVAKYKPEWATIRLPGVQKLKRRGEGGMLAEQDKLVPMT
ncbi:stage II sporulation protein E [Tumebacillus permanentifrigoris]|uniref:Stage II sporulation protein E n=1 Tax=Tumebacillus permanentifrigoris TaxID=378543 RepID=A0A316DF34_9BACL|nr:stage II sporulation protein E [Tumebacillus permanentifrigoris]PWK16336.1 stage II sporulation protein E [Tumebacillus permanentifrigoris]